LMYEILKQKIKRDRNWKISLLMAIT
jgi:hypothetical protein